MPVAHLDAPDVPDAHAVEGVVHEVLDRGEHGRDEIGVFVRRKSAREVDKGGAACVGKIHMFDSSSKRMREFDHAALRCCGALNPLCGHYLRRYCLTREPVTGLPTSARGRWSLGVRHPEQVAAETDAHFEVGLEEPP